MLRVGQSATLERRFTPEDVEDYIALGGAKTRPGVVPEPMLGALFSRLLGVELPGVGTNYLKQATEFERPARVGEKLTGRVVITRLRLEKFLVDLETTCVNEAGDLVCKGRALVYVKDVLATAGAGIPGD